MKRFSNRPKCMSCTDDAVRIQLCQFLRGEFAEMCCMLYCRQELHALPCTCWLIRPIHCRTRPSNRPLQTEQRRCIFSRCVLGHSLTTQMWLHCEPTHGSLLHEDAACLTAHSTALSAVDGRLIAYMQAPGDRPFRIIGGWWFWNKRKK